MDNLPVNLLDLMVIAAFLIGGLVGLALGFIRGGLFILSWVGAGLAALFAFPLARPYARQAIETAWIADLAAGAALFLVALVILFLLSSLIGSWVRTSRLNALDRSLGMVAGLATTALVISGLYLISETIWPPDKQPAWIKEARSITLIRGAARLLDSVLPRDAALLGAEKAKGAADEARKIIERETYKRLVGPPPKDKAGTERPGYDIKDRRDMDRLYQSGN